MRTNTSSIRLKPGDSYDLRVSPQRLKIAIGGYAAERAPDLQFSFCCFAYRRPDQGPDLGLVDFIGAEHTIMLEGSVRQSENRFSVDEWGDCFIVKLGDIPDDITCLLFYGYFTLPSTQDKLSGSLKEHFLRLTDQDTGKEILRVDLSEQCPINSSITYALLSRASGKDGWHFQFMP